MKIIEEVFTHHHWFFHDLELRWRNVMVNSKIMIFYEGLRRSFI